MRHELDPVQAAQSKQHLHQLFQPIWELGQFTPQNYLIEDWLPLGQLIVLAGAPKSGKTSLATQLALAVATGTPFAGMPTKQSPVLWLSLEEGWPERRILLRDNPLAQSSTPFYTCFESLPIDREESLDALDHWILETEAKLIVVDPLQAAISGGRSLEHGGTARKVLTPLRNLCLSRGVTAIVLHHARPRSPNTARIRVADHAQISATAGMLITMDSRSATQGRIIELVCAGRGQHANRTLHLQSNNLGDYHLADNKELSKPRKPQLKPYASDRVITYLKTNCSDGEGLCNALQMNPFTLRHHLNYLRKNGLIKVLRKGCGRNIYAGLDWSDERMIEQQDRNDKVRQELSDIHREKIEREMGEKLMVGRSVASH